MKVHVTNFQSLKDTTLDVAGLTVLVGPSHRGKSAMIRAIEGALFNRPGDAYVREGAKECRVELSDLPGAGQHVVWTKGKGAKYVVDGEAFSKVGKDAPPTLQAAGYRDLWIGDQEKKTGEYLRPQVATQFDPLFLLTRPGSLLADVLHFITRLRVVTMAQDRCAADLRSTKQQLGVQQATVEAARARRDALAGAPELLTRIKCLRVEQAALDGLKQRVADLRALKARRDRLLPVPRELPDDYPSQAKFETVQRLSRILSLAQLRPRVRACLQIPPEVTSLRPLALAMDKRSSLLDVVERRDRLVTVLAQELPPTTLDASALDALASMRQQVESLESRQRQAIEVFYRCEAASRAAETNVLEAETAFREAFDALGMCPLCEQEIDHEHSSESTAVTE